MDSTRNLVACHNWPEMAWLRPFLIHTVPSVWLWPNSGPCYQGQSDFIFNRLWYILHAENGHNGHDIRCPVAIAEGIFWYPKLIWRLQLQWLPTELMLPALVWYWLIPGPLGHVSYKYATTGNKLELCYQNSFNSGWFLAHYDNSTNSPPDICHNGWESWN